MNNKYIIYIFGDQSKFDNFKQRFENYKTRHKIKESIEYINFSDDHKANKIKEICQNNEVIGVYFSQNSQDDSLKKATINALKELESQGIPIFPVVYNLEKTIEELKEYKVLHKYNVCPYEKTDSNNYQAPYVLFSNIISAFHLISWQRKIFISYKRDESLHIATQLRDALVLRGYRVFLDTHNIPYGADFQKELMSNLNDSDIVLYLHTANSNASQWISREIVAAEVRGVNLIDIRWPTHNKCDNLLPFSAIINLEENAFNGNLLWDKDCNKVCKEVESHRVRSLVLRRSELYNSWMNQKNIAKNKIIKYNVNDEVQVIHYSKDRSVHQDILCYKIPDIRSIYRYINDTEIKSKTLYCRLAGYADEHKETFKWLCKKIGIKLYQYKHSGKNKLRIFLSAGDLSDEEKELYPFKSYVIQRAITSLINVFIPHSVIVFGGHPFISPFVLEIAEQYKLKKNITIYQSKYFEDKVEDIIKNQKNKLDIRWTEKKNKQGIDDKALSLQEMREKMISENFDAAFFVGGMDGVKDEYDIFKRKYADKPAFVLPTTGGAAKKIHERLYDPKEIYQWPKGYTKAKYSYKKYTFVSIFSEILEALINKNL